MKFLSFLIFIAIGTATFAQSFELLPGTKRIFIDAQYLKFLDSEFRVSLFSRGRATAEYDEQKTDLFTGAYLNYTTKSGWGGTLLGRISSGNAGVDAGIHYFKATKSLMIYALASININDELLYSWFSILRATTDLTHNSKLYTSLELFSVFNQTGHLSSVQRLRLGLDRKGYQIGGAININTGRFSDADVNSGVFLRKQF